MVGDVLSDNLEKKDRFLYKFMLEASDNPLDSFGIGVGFRFNSRKIGDQTLTSFIAFVGSFWTKEDDISNGVAKKNDSYTQDWGIGISYSLDKAIFLVEEVAPSLERLRSAGSDG
ncbi:MAG: hypothetical protein O7E52_16795 [Candidatus Poribacteria bacterium]|nr:hypothetical protein [Candidatus Poribacteria bacterium]